MPPGRRPPAVAPGQAIFSSGARAATRSRPRARRRDRPEPDERRPDAAAVEAIVTVGRRHDAVVPGRLSAEPRSRPWRSSWRRARELMRRRECFLRRRATARGGPGRGVARHRRLRRRGRARDRRGDATRRQRRLARPPSLRPRRRFPSATGRTASRSPTTASSGSPTRPRGAVAQISGRDAVVGRPSAPDASPTARCRRRCGLGGPRPTMRSAGSRTAAPDHPRGAGAGVAGGRRRYIWVTNARRGDGHAASIAPPARSSARRSASAGARWTSLSTMSSPGSRASRTAP